MAVRAFWKCLAVAFALLWSGAVGATAPRTFGPFNVDTDRPEVIELKGAIGAGSALDFRRALLALPNAKLIVLDSPGGLVSMGLLIADDIHQRKLATFVPNGSECMSACAFLYFAGAERQVDGKLGVHQISADIPDLTSAQLSISDIIDVLNRFETPIEVLTVMFRTPADEMHVFTTEEIAAYHLNHKAGAPAPAIAADAPSPAAAADATTLSAALAPDLERDVPASPPVVSSATPSPLPLAVPREEANRTLSAIEDYARRPNRMALYSGLDFLGRDLDGVAVSDAPSCALQCLSNRSCKAFTFNVKTQAGRGPNCFLKSSQGELDGNSVAISGLLLGRADADPQTMHFGAIDPNTNLYKDVDIPGFDLSRKAHAGAKTPFDCRMACVKDGRCAAFTFVKRKKECWLKSGIGQPRFMEGAVTGAKTPMTFEPKTVSLQ